MPARKILPDVPKLLQLVDRGMTHQQIADLYGTSRQAVTLKLKGATVPKAHRHDWPWEVQPRHKSGWLYQAISYWKIAQEKERPLTERERQRLSSFLNMLESLPGDYVVTYVPDSASGFRLRPRTRGDDPNSILATEEAHVPDPRPAPSGRPTRSGR